MSLESLPQITHGQKVYLHNFLYENLGHIQGLFPAPVTIPKDHILLKNASIYIALDEWVKKMRLIHHIDQADASIAREFDEEDTEVASVFSEISHSQLVEVFGSISNLTLKLDVAFIPYGGEEEFSNMFYATYISKFSLENGNWDFIVKTEAPLNYNKKSYIYNLEVTAKKQGGELHRLYHFQGYMGEDSFYDEFNEEDVDNILAELFPDAQIGCGVMISELLMIGMPLDFETELIFKHMRCFYEAEMPCFEEIRRHAVYAAILFGVND